ncbi:hypothetical protein AB0M12_02565, partial [Nocardia vinacea]|uniref:hypothetical protein n=1 Tax=Nocardia vinacea TaxID=96468 RepID=UPI0034479AE6
QLTPVDNPADRSLNSDDPQQLSISEQGVQHGAAASPSKPQQQADNHQPHPTALGIQGTNPRHLQT